MKVIKSEYTLQLDQNEVDTLIRILECALNALSDEQNEFQKVITTVDIVKIMNCLNNLNRN